MLDIIKDQMVRTIISKFNVTHEISVNTSLVKDWGKFIDFSLPKGVKNIVIILPENYDNEIREQIRNVRGDLSVIVIKSPEIKDKLYVLY
ncbi:DUF4898 domain-containing protein [Stygiolobus caldivivus]|uniref:DUF4898 domain-containing protein n=1 Tax=Stygiolobus caldivivus TaxID=2824673 RepID=UPI001C8491D9|nr:DUF4898 domain-containing protein [Stygiolobus caldivivus]